MSISTEWEYRETYPEDGWYLCRMDEDDEEPMRVQVKNGMAFGESGKRKIIYGFEWKPIQ